jgi:sugar phosphate isomerase/epimerase
VIKDIQPNHRHRTKEHAMSTTPPERSFPLNRRSFLQIGAAGLSGLALGQAAAQGQAGKDKPAPRGKPTKFQIACMTLPYAQFPLERALKGIKAAGYHYVAWGTTHKEANGKAVPVLAEDAAPAKAKELAKRCRYMGLEPLMMFSMIYPENKNAIKVLTNRILQAAAGGLPQVLTFGHTEGGNAKVWVERFKKLGPIARENGVLLVVKQHGGKTGTGQACAAITREVADDGIKVNYDAGNVMDYLHLDPLPDIRKCADEVRSFCIKDHRRFPKDGDCGPGFGEIDHYRLLAPVAFTGRTMPLCCENIFAPIIPRPTKPEGVDALARRAREFLEVVIQGLQM